MAQWVTEYYASRKVRVTSTESGKLPQSQKSQILIPALRRKTQGNLEQVGKLEYVPTLCDIERVCQ